MSSTTPRNTTPTYPGVSFMLSGPAATVTAAMEGLKAVPGLKICTWSARPDRDNPDDLRGRGVFEIVTPRAPRPAKATS